VCAAAVKGDNDGVHEQELFLQLVDTVPHWYTAEHGPVAHSFTVDSHHLQFFSHSRPGPELSAILDLIQSHLREWADSLPEFAAFRDLSLIQRQVAVAWLRLHDPDVAWERLLAWADRLEFRTAENRNQSLNLILSPGRGTTDVTHVSLQKGLDSIATTGEVFLEVDKHLRFIDYREIAKDDMCAVRFPSLGPAFLDPFTSVLGPGQWSFHMTERGERVVLGQSGLLAAFRKGRWFIYDRPALVQAAAAIFGGLEVGRNVLLTALDLSYLRRGALLVFDPDRRVAQHLVGSAYRGTAEHEAPDIQSLLASRVATIRMSAADERESQRKLLFELAALDGAVLFDASSVLAFGSILHMHDAAQRHLGARTTAAYSSFHWGGVPILISADGEITVVFKSGDPSKGKAAMATLSLM
jgi:hypothetical protein